MLTSARCDGRLIGRALFKHRLCLDSSRYISTKKTESSSKLTHVDQSGKAHMVSVADKQTTHRIAVARGHVQTTSQAIGLILDNAVKKGDVLATARVAGIMASKRTSELIPLCHNIALTKVAVELKVDQDEKKIMIEAKAECVGYTGVEMEALTACTTAALTIYDMLKAVDKGMIISNIRVVEKQGGKSGNWTAP